MEGLFKKQLNIIHIIMIFMLFFFIFYIDIIEKYAQWRNGLDDEKQYTQFFTSKDYEQHPITSEDQHSINQVICYE